jgi:hypothetical protein
MASQCNSENTKHPVSQFRALLSGGNTELLELERAWVPNTPRRFAGHVS